jgi:hypothetical protein
MARKQRSKQQPEYVLFDVLYEDGTRTSNRKVPRSALDTLDGDDPARDIIEAQDTEIAERSGRNRAPIKQVVRSAANANVK